MRDYNDIESLFDEAIERDDLDGLKALIAQHGGVEQISAMVVHVAVSNKKPEVLEWLLSQGFDPNQNQPGEAYFEQTPLFWATFPRHRQMMEILVRYGARVSAEVGVDETSLHLVAADGDLEDLTFLLEHADGRNALEVKDFLRRTPLQCAVESQNIAAVRILLEAGADGNNLYDPIDGPALLAAMLQDELERQAPPTPVGWRFPPTRSVIDGVRKKL